MQYDIQAFSLPKIGESSSTNQDRLAYSAGDCMFAISDGAGSSLYPGEWARLLVDSFCERDPSVNFFVPSIMEQWLPPLQQEWRKFYLEKLQAPNKQWWQGGSSTKSHGAATFLGVILSSPQSNQNRWSAIAVGDSCLFQYQCEKQVLVSFPLQTSAAFKSTTACLASLPEYPSAPPILTEGSFDVGDCFFLATDALSQCILMNYENRNSKWQELLTVNSEQAFHAFIEQLRHHRQIKNDDTSLIRIQILPE